MAIRGSTEMPSDNPPATQGDVTEVIRLIEYDLLNRQTGLHNGFIGQQTDVATLIQAYMGLTTAVRAFLAKYDECEPYLTSVMFVAANHSTPYSGPDWSAELAALREAVRKKA